MVPEGVGCGVTSLLHEPWINALDAYVRPPSHDCFNVRLMLRHSTRNKTKASGGNKEQHTLRNPSPLRRYLMLKNF